MGDDCCVPYLQTNYCSAAQRSHLKVTYFLFFFPTRAFWLVQKRLWFPCRRVCWGSGHRPGTTKQAQEFPLYLISPWPAPISELFPQLPSWSKSQQMVTEMDLVFLGCKAFGKAKHSKKNESQALVIYKELSHSLNNVRISRSCQGF